MPICLWVKVDLYSIQRIVRIRFSSNASDAGTYAEKVFVDQRSFVHPYGFVSCRSVVVAIA
jgi:hypothetical protein